MHQLQLLLSSCHPSIFLSLLLHLLTQSPPFLSVVVVMEMLQTSRGISWQNSGVQGVGWRVTVGVGVPVGILPL